MEEREYILLALSNIRGVGRNVVRRARKLTEALDFAAHSVTDIRELLGISTKKAELIKAEFDMEKTMDYVRRWCDHGITVLTWLNPLYPALLREIPDPPEVLYITGNKELLSYPALAIVGTRTPTVYGKNAARQFARDLAAKGFCIVSGLARGVDSEAHRGALEAGGATIAILGCGIDIVYPNENRKLAAELRRQGLIISEYPPGVEPRRRFFPERNRLISGLARGVLVIEAAARSGSLITADLAAEQGRDVYALPGSVYSPKSVGCHWLIQQGAKLVHNVYDIVSEYPWMVSDTNENTTDHTLSSSIKLSEEEKIVLELIGGESVSYEEILCRTAFSSSHLHYLLLSLQVKQKIEQLPGPAFIRMKE
ncbi:MULTISPECIES: DNA-processing protein DprA [Aneurinibacillus]|uniref:DNA processing protein n=1 Tax=Aneurinibacillus thermoaerophilus TaxID=143495 RepID=A0A1G7WDU8_ANETH|nr:MULTISPECIES: DNA-processing protein DprA [Aneurinibacillus]AMA72656.1 hypothetical protein ACH33_07195 [Aneurinibacillus sp. XH2]MED0674627.1 DNA-processing protein DprA [Aneurinibacillus thermoaerophilus]MED0677996.1 DNA-processing protein DprA [Aneurinibacillus thermoaerophilus]MED0736941.1 DNA-processing protein DprA [Aneurinibacillus thermoaerophilus]MED0756782.1 DNA-processing protein DprA [Aneurinibacillus thermoaerophilus]